MVQNRPSNVLEVLRQALEDGHVTISRAAMTLGYPARFLLIASMNPCWRPLAWEPKHAGSSDAICSY